MENPLKYAAKFSRRGILAARNVGDRLGSNHTWRPERGKGISPAFSGLPRGSTEALQSQKPHPKLPYAGAARTAAHCPITEEEPRSWIKSTNPWIVGAKS